jgi:UDP-3-O-[3-hydroxymyristoyl] glucosamine N-acyltransferase
MDFAGTYRVGIPAWKGFWQMVTPLADLAALVNGTICGDAGVTVAGAATLADVRPGEITLVDRNERADQLKASSAVASVVPNNFPIEGASMPLLRVDDVHAAFTSIVLHFRPARSSKPVGMSPLAIVSSSTVLAAGVQVHAGASLGEYVELGPGCIIHSGAHLMTGCKLGANVTVFPGAILYEGTVVGDRSIIHAGAVIGGYGFGYKLVAGQHQLSAQLGNVQIGCDVEVGANTTIDRGTYGPTIIGDGTKIDNQVQVAHNCRIGKHNMLCSQVGIAGSTSTGDYVVMAGQVGVRDHVHIGDKAILGAMAGVVNDVPAGSVMIGIPATPEREQKLKQAALSKLPEMRKDLKELKHTVERLVGEQSRKAA